MSDVIHELTARLIKFREERDWKQFHNPKDMALSLSLEVGELLELMQWKNGQELTDHLNANKQAVSEELADVFGWLLYLAHDLQIDLGEALYKKIEKNAIKYPIEKSKGTAKKYTEL
jgi:dCTP diphosphatase